jgi:hypothetical protein
MKGGAVVVGQGVLLNRRRQSLCVLLHVFDGGGQGILGLTHHIGEFLGDGGHAREVRKGEGPVALAGQAIRDRQIVLCCHACFSCSA